MLRHGIFIMWGCLSLGIFVYPQSPEPDDVIYVSNGQCELNIRAYEVVMKNSLEKNDRVYIISRRSRVEKQGVDWVRLKYAKSVLTNFRKFPAELITLAVGEQSDLEYGKLEFWVGSRLQMVSYIRRNQQICLQIPDYLPN